MKYILVLGIEYKKFKNQAKISVEVGNKFVDTFELDQDYLGTKKMQSYLEPYWYNKLDKNIWLSIKPQGPQDWQSAPNFFKVYEIHEYNLNDVLRIGVENSNSDYTNGFMKNSSLMRLSIVALFPKLAVENKGEKLMKICTKINTGYRKYLKRNKINTDNSPPRDPWFWPIANSFYVKRYDTKFDRSRIQTFREWIGGNFVAEFPIRKKHKIKYFGSMQTKEKGFPLTSIAYCLTISSCSPLLNIYNEDQ